MTDQTRPVNAKRAHRNLRPKPSLGIIPAIISDQTSYASIGLTGGQLREIVRAHGIPHRVVGQRMLVLVEDVVAFVEGVASIDAANQPPIIGDDQPDDVDTVLARIGRRRTA